MNTMTDMLKSLQDDLHMAQTQRNNALADNAALRAQLRTETELRESAQKDFADLCAFLRGEEPPTCHAHVKEAASRAMARIETYENAHRLFDINLVELLQRCQNGEATCIFTAQIVENELTALRAENAALEGGAK